MHIPASTRPLIWNRALVWSEHDAWMSWLHVGQVVLVCIAILVMAVGSVMASYAYNELLRAAPAATVNAPMLPTPPCGAVPRISWFPAW